MSCEEIESSFDQIEQKLKQLLFTESNDRVIFFVYVITFSSNELLVQTFSEFLMDLDYSSQIVNFTFERPPEEQCLIILSFNQLLFIKVCYYEWTNLKNSNYPNLPYQIS